MKARVRGKAELAKAFAGLPKEVRQAATVSTVKSAEELAAAQRLLAPAVTGKLRDSITVTGPGGEIPKYAFTGKGGRRRSGGGRVGEHAATVTAGNSEVRYAHLVEFGARPAIAGGKFAGAQIPARAPRPFFWPAFRLLRTRLLGRMTRATGKAIRDIWKR